jgi:hypothetical protein
MVLATQSCTASHRSCSSRTSARFRRESVRATADGHCVAGRQPTIISIPATDSFEAAPARHTVVFPYLLERSIYQKRIDAGHELEEKQAGTSRRKQWQTMLLIFCGCCPLCKPSIRLLSLCDYVGSSGESRECRVVSKRRNAYSGRAFRIQRGMPDESGQRRMPDGHCPFGTARRADSAGDGERGDGESPHHHRQQLPLRVWRAFSRPPTPSMLLLW